LLMSFHFSKNALVQLFVGLLMPGSQNVVSWTAMINGCIQNGDTPLAAPIFSRMREDGVALNDFTYSTILTASVASMPGS